MIQVDNVVILWRATTSTSPQPTAELSHAMKHELGRASDFARIAALLASVREQAPPTEGGAVVSAELNEMDTLSRRLDTCSDEVKELRRALTALIDTTTWTGRAADEFHDKWRTEFNPVLTNMADALTTEGQEVRKRRDRFDFAGNHK